MRRMAIGTVVGVAVWMGSALAAEAQQITPTGPLSVNAGATTSTYTANVYLPTPSNYVVRLWVMRGTTNLHYSQTVVPNPGTNNCVFTKDAGFNQSVSAGDQLVFKVALKVGTVWVPASYPINGDTIDLGPITVGPSRPSSKMTGVQKAPALALQSIDRDRRRE